MIKKIVFFLMSLSLLASKIDFAENLNHILSEKLNHVTTYASDFNQTVTDDAGNILLVSHGYMQFHRPHAFYWQVLSPSPQTMWYRDHAWIMYDKRLKQATIQSIHSLKDPNVWPLMLLTGDADKVLENFSVTAQGNVYFLRPKHKDQAALLRAIRLVLTQEGAIKKIQYQTALDQKTEVNFEHVIVNKKVNESLFTEPLPAGTDVIHVAV